MNLDSKARNAEFVKGVREAERLKKEEEEAGLDGAELQRRRDAEAEAKAHERVKSAHYSKLGVTFATGGSPLGGTGGRGTPHSSGKTGPGSGKAGAPMSAARFKQGVVELK
jgi:hypothetical protein